MAYGESATQTNNRKNDPHRLEQERVGCRSHNLSQNAFDLSNKSVAFIVANVNLLTEVASVGGVLLVYHVCGIGAAAPVHYTGWSGWGSP